MKRTIFVVGNSRSGTTMMGRVLGGHPDVFTFNELHFFEQLWNPTPEPEPIDRATASNLVAQLITIQRDGYYNQKDVSVYRYEADQILRLIPNPITPPAVYQAFIDHETNWNHKSIACDQTPRNLYYIKELLELFPEARFVVMVRDPRDVLLSQKNRYKRRRLGAKGTPWTNALRTWAGYHPITISLLWRSGVAAGDRFSDDPRVCVVRFEDLLNNPMPQLKRICEATGLMFNTSMLNVPRVGSSHRHDRPTQLGLDPSAAGRWRNGGLTRTEIALCQNLTHEHMAHHGYAIQPVNAPAATLLWRRITWLFKSALALVLNFRRITNLRESLRRRLAR